MNSASSASRTHPIAGVAPVLCAVHCLAAPLLVAVAPALAESTPLELALVGASLAVGASAASTGVRVHGERRVWIPVLLALLIYAGIQGTGVDGTAETVGMLFGSVSMLSALAWDGRLRESAFSPHAIRDFSEDPARCHP